jgi:hypothetical protein
VNGSTTFALPAGTTKVNQIVIGSGGRSTSGATA